MCFRKGVGRPCILSSFGSFTHMYLERRASPEVAPYPFTTLMPNLGVLAGAPEGNDPSPEVRLACFHTLVVT